MAETSTIEVRVLADRIAYRAIGEGEDGKKKAIRYTAERGSVIHLSEAEYKRLSTLEPPAVGTEEDLMRAMLASGPTASGNRVTVPTSASSLRLMFVDDLAAFMATADDTAQEQVAAWMDEVIAEKQAEQGTALATATAEASRLAATGGVVTPTGPVAKAAVAHGTGLSETVTPPATPATTATTSTPTPVGASDDDLAAMNVDTLTAYISQHPAELDRIETLENKWGKGQDGGPRKGIVDVLERTRQALEDADQG